MTVQPTRDQLRALADAATEGPWEADGPAQAGPDDTLTVYPVADGGAVAYVQPLWADAEFIAAARTAVPHLLDQLDAAERRIRDLTQEVRDERGAARDQMEQVRIRDARIQAVRDVLDEQEAHFRAFWAANGKPDAATPGIPVADIRRALEG